MHVVSLHLPAIRDLRLAAQPAPATIAELYLQVEDLLVALHREQACAKELRQDSERLKGRLLELVDGLDTDFSSAAAKEFTLASLTGGMFAGALDGTLLFSHDERVKQPPTESTHAYLSGPSRLLWQNLDRILDVGAANWRQAHVDDLQLLSGYGKHENRHSIEEGEALERQTRGDRSQFHAFLLASFKGGYAMGVVDAAVMFVGGERPGAPPSST